ncbi:hypothetical protein AHAS_Ahas19G0244100 [Arachis hypogaea]
MHLERPLDSPVALVVPNPSVAGFMASRESVITRAVALGPGAATTGGFEQNLLLEAFGGFSVVPVVSAIRTVIIGGITNFAAYAFAHAILALDTFNTTVISAVYYVMFTTFTNFASMIMFKVTFTFVPIMNFLLQHYTLESVDLFSHKICVGTLQMMFFSTLVV